jgi:hypothetical protein
MHHEASPFEKKMAPFPCRINSVWQQWNLEPQRILSFHPPSSGLLLAVFEQLDTLVVVYFKTRTEPNYSPNVSGHGMMTLCVISDKEAPRTPWNKVLVNHFELC